MIPQVPLTCRLEHPERGDLPWSKWVAVDALGMVVCGGMDKRAAELMVIWANEYARMRAALVGVARIGSGEVERLACVGLGESWWESVEWVEIVGRMG